MIKGINATEILIHEEIYVLLKFTFNQEVNKKLKNIFYIIIKNKSNLVKLIL
ncbi:hypothetical protein BJB63x_006010 [Bartonella sp. JB63]|nr:hypothetical protein BJB15x_006070 [Bartonella sp. JB15]AQX29287.1 hypothetical protein BJB63x_006010 [Bartonella sp. JB63]